MCRGVGFLTVESERGWKRRWVWVIHSTEGSAVAWEVSSKKLREGPNTSCGFGTSSVRSMQTPPCACGQTLYEACPRRDRVYVKGPRTMRMVCKSQLRQFLSSWLDKIRRGDSAQLSDGKL